MEATYVPGTEMTEEQFVQEYTDRVKVEDGNVDPSEADEWARNTVKLDEMTLGMKARISEAVLTNLASDEEEAVEGPVSDSEGDTAEEATTPAVQAENAAESVTEAPVAMSEASLGEA